MKQILIALATLTLATTALAGGNIPRKCVAPDGSISYSTNRTCPNGGQRKRMTQGTYTAVPLLEGVVSVSQQPRRQIELRETMTQPVER